jgi:hypothetical protein
LDYWLTSQYAWHNIFKITIDDSRVEEYERG